MTSLTSSPPNSMWKLKLLLAPAPVFAGLAERLFKRDRGVGARREGEQRAEGSERERHARKLFAHPARSSRILGAGAHPIHCDLQRSSGACGPLHAAG